ncbi:MAG: cytochrome P450 [Spirochaetaceae bacterium]|nr:cytochrome P450 [Myxococcales bacterium]MCB9724304.1 cytochrome P450 [Spirochaetaceae bacterium]
MDRMDYDPFSDDVMRDPWPYYARLRREAPVYYSEKYDTWFLSKFEDIRASTTNDVFSAEKGVSPEMVILKSPPPPDPVFSMLDLPRAKYYRRIFSPRYTRRAVESMADEMRALTRELLAPLRERRSFDVYRDLADPLATFVIADLIGLPREEALTLRAHVADFFAREPGQIGTNERNQQAMIALMTRLAEIIGARMAEGAGEGDDHISVMLRSEIEGAPMSLPAMVAATHTMLVTGAEVVPLSVANTILYLARHPDQRRALVEDPALIPYAYAESLRYDQPTNLLGRTVKDPVEIRGQKLLPGQGVMFLWASGNRDEEEFPEADRFDVHRRPPRTLSFGHGAHKCIGEHLGLLEGRILLEEILAMAPEYEVDESGAQRVYGEFLHGYHRMPIGF